MATSVASKRFETDSKLVSGYFRIYAIATLIPMDVIKECLKFFHIAMRWDKYSEDWVVDEHQTIAELKHCDSDWSVIYSSPVIANGYHHWKLRMVDLPSENMYLGITTITDLLNDATWNHCSSGYFYYWGNGGCPDFCCNSDDAIKSIIIITVTLSQ